MQRLSTGSTLYTVQGVQGVHCTGSTGCTKCTGCTGCTVSTECAGCSGCTGCTECTVCTGVQVTEGGILYMEYNLFKGVNCLKLLGEQIIFANCSNTSSQKRGT